jgi:hypothetical protein
METYIAETRAAEKTDAINTIVQQYGLSDIEWNGLLM